MCMPVSESVCVSLREILDTASYLPLYIFLALPPSRISMLESAQRQQPARHEYKGRQTSRRRGGKKKKRKSQRRLGQAQGTQAVQRQAGSEHSASHKAAFSCRTKKTLRKWKRIHRKRKAGGGEVHLGICLDAILLPVEAWRVAILPPHGELKILPIFLSACFCCRMKNSKKILSWIYYPMWNLCYSKFKKRGKKLTMRDKMSGREREWIDRHQLINPNVSDKEEGPRSSTLWLAQGN